MNDRKRSQLRLGFTALVALATLAHLVWQHVSGGVPSHHLLHRSDMPAISNWWSMLVLPALSWWLVGRVQERIRSQNDKGAVAAAAMGAIVGFASSLLMGGILSFCFAHGYESATSYVLLGILLLAVLLPAYRAECLLGFVLGMAPAFGGVLPALVGSVIAALSAVVRLCLIPRLVRV